MTRRRRLGKKRTGSIGAIAAIAGLALILLGVPVFAYWNRKRAAETRDPVNVYSATSHSSRGKMLP
jgi:hypothetical protein